MSRFHRGETPCELAVKALDGIVDEYFALPSYAQAGEQLHFKNQFYGALKMLPCLPICSYEWELLRQCVARNDVRLRLDSVEIGATLKWITEREKMD